MIWILYVVGGLAALIALMAGLGLLLRADHVASRSAEIPRPPAEVDAAIRDLARHPTWRTGVKRIELLPDVDGKRAFREHGKHGAIPFVVDEDAPGRLVTRIADDKLPFGGRWIIEVAPAPGGSRVTITEEGFVKNPVFRLLSRTVFSPTATIEQYLRDLGRGGVGVGR